jgi:hypothetical protein
LEGPIGSGITGIHEGHQPGKPVLSVPDLVKHQDHSEAGEQQEVADLGARAEEHKTPKQRNQSRHREVGLQEDHD